MADKLEMFRMIPQGGLNRKDNWIDLSESYPGMAATLINFEPSLYGGYRRLSGFAALESSFSEVAPDEAEGKILGVFIYNGAIYAARKDQGSATYSFYRRVPGDEWLLVSNDYSPVSSGVDLVRYDTFNFDGTEKVVFVDGVNPPVCYDGTDWNVLTGDQELPAPRFVNVYKNHIFVSGDNTYPHLVAHSAPSDEETWDASAGAGQIIMGFNVVQIKTWRDINVVFGKTKIKYIAVEGTDFTVKEITDDLGCLSSDSVVEANGDLMFLSQDGIRPISATERNEDYELASISKNIQELFITTFNTVTESNVQAIPVRAKSQIRFFLKEESIADTQAKGLLAGLAVDQGSQAWEWAELRGIKVACATSQYVGNVEYVLHGSYDGIVYRQEVGSSFAGENITSLYITPYYDYGSPITRKSIRRAILFVRPEGNVDMNVGIKYDWGGDEVHNPADYPFEALSSVAVWNQAIYNQSVYASTPTAIVFKDVEGSGFSNNFIFTSSNTLPSFSIQSVIVELTPNGFE